MLAARKSILCFDVLIGAGLLDHVGERFLRREIEGLCGLKRNRRLGKIGAVGFAAHPEHVVFEWRQAFRKLEFEAVPAAADPGLFEIGAIAIGEDTPDQPVIIGDQ